MLPHPLGLAAEEIANGRTGGESLRDEPFALIEGEDFA